MTVWCPRKWCQNAALNNKYPKPTVPLEEMHDVDDADETPHVDALTLNDPKDDDEATKEKKFLQDRLRICESCEYAFCRLCNFTWHGPHLRLPLPNREAVRRSLKRKRRPRTSSCSTPHPARIAICPSKRRMHVTTCAARNATRTSVTFAVN